MSAQRLLIIDDDAEVCEFIKTVAESCGLRTTVASDHTRFQDYYRECDPDLVVTDLQMPGVDGIEVLRFLAAERSRAQVVVLSGVDTKLLTTAQRLAASLGLNVIEAVQKPVRVAALKAVFDKAAGAEQPISPKALEAGIKAGELVPFYQPKVRFTEPGRSLEGVEALVRWQHPTLGLLAPDAFVPMAEETGLIGALTHAVLESSLEQIRRWRADGLDLSLAVNLSPYLVNDLDLPDSTAALVARSRVEPERITLEITETGVMRDTAKAMDILTRFRLKGFELAVDDFGTGYSSLVQLYRMPFTEMKIDKSFVTDLERDHEARVIVKAVVDLAHTLSLSVCAEGVESRAAVSFLSSLGCEKGQGYLFSKPLPGHELQRWVDGWRNRREACA